MRIYKSKDIKKKVNTGLAILCVLLFWAFNSPKGWAEAEKDIKIDEKKTSYPQTEDAAFIRSFDRFQVEFYGGIIFLNPQDLNLFVSHDARLQEFFYDSYFDYLVATDQIQSWTRNQGEERKEITRSYPIGGRIKYYISETIALSLGFKYQTSSQNMDLEYEYFRNELSDERYNEAIRYSPYSLSAKAYIPTIGVHITKKLKDTLTMEAFISGGPMFADCRYFTEWSYEWVTEGPGYRYVTYNRNGVLEEKGSGTGIAVDLGGRFSYPIISRFEIFLEAGYAYQVVKSISGPGGEEMDGRSTTWDGRWGIKRETVAAAWGELEMEFPTAHWSDNSEEDRVRDFELDLSGFQLRLGLSFRF
ncbi:MAG: hypothetical protein PVH84_15800 [Candidatus Aminicenantes bacterium]